MSIKTIVPLPDAPERADPGGRLIVGLFGYYSYRNHGDHLMAYLLAEHIKSLGHKPVIFSKWAADMAGWHVDVVSEPEAFARTVDVIVFGGGGVLIPRRHLNEDGADFNADLGQVLDAAAGDETPLFGISIGGAGARLDQIVPLERQQLLRRLHYVTLRNREDLPLLAEAGVAGEFLDDLVWTAATVFPLKGVERGGRKRVGINFYLGRSRRYRLVRTIIGLVTRLRPDIDFVFLDNQPGRNGEFQAFKPARRTANTTCETLVELDAACRELASLDVLFTTRLHVGLVAMCYGVPSVVYAGKMKTRLLYNRIGRGHLFWSSKDVMKFLRVFLLPGGLDRLIQSGRQPIEPIVFHSAAKHYERLTQLLTKVTDQSSNGIVRRKL